MVANENEEGLYAYQYSQDGDLISATVDGITTTYTYDGIGNRLMMSVAGEDTTYTVDYANNFRLLYEQGGAFSETKHYLYGYACLGEVADVGTPDEEPRYYLRDGNRMVRQVTDETATITLAWTYSPEGMILVGEKGPVTNLDCSGNAVYDFSTGLIFKNGRYFDPSTGIYTTMGGVVIYRAHFTPNRQLRRKERHFSRKYHILLLLLLVLLLASCGGSDNSTPIPNLYPTEVPTTTPCPTPSFTPTIMPTGTPPFTPTPLPTSTLRPMNTSTPTFVPTITPVSSHNNLKLTNPFGLGKKFLLVNDYGNTEYGYQTGLGGGQGNGHPGIDLIPVDYALASKADNYTPVSNHRDLYAPISGIINREPDETNISIIVPVIEGSVTIDITHVDSNEGVESLPNDSVVNRGQALNMSFKGQGYGYGSDYPHLHLEVYSEDNGSRVYLDPFPMLANSPDYVGNYWNFLDPADNTYFTQLPGPGN